jgi:hypothetical protein
MVCYFLSILSQILSAYRIMDQLGEFAFKVLDKGQHGLSLQVSKDIIDLLFCGCCKDYPGAVDVRQSFDAYQSMSLADFQEWKEQGGGGLEWKQRLYFSPEACTLLTPHQPSGVVLQTIEVFAYQSAVCESELFMHEILPSMDIDSASRYLEPSSFHTASL